VRYRLGDDRTSITASALDTNREAYAICAQDVTILPCGIGPNNLNFGRYALAYGTVQSLIGNVQTNFSAYANSGNQRPTTSTATSSPRQRQPQRSVLVRADPRSLGTSATR
jgi:hypothetical protein